MLFPTPLRYKVLNSALAGLAILILYGTVTAVALQEPALLPTRSTSRLQTVAVAVTPSRATSIPTNVPTPSLSQIVAPRAQIERAPSMFQLEQTMSPAQLMKRWEPLIKRAARRFELPASWIREVMRMESGGRTMLAEHAQMVSSQGALGLMQLLPGTYAEIRAQYGFGRDPFDPHDNVFAGTAYLRWLHAKYGYPAMFEAYDDGPGNVEQRAIKRQVLPVETRNYVSVITLKLGGSLPGTNPSTASIVNLNPTTLMTPSASRPIALTSATTTPCAFTHPDGSVLVVDCSQVTSVHAAPIEDSSSQTQAVVTIGSVEEHVRESEEIVKQLVLSHGGHL